MKKYMKEETIADGLLEDNANEMRSYVERLKSSLVKFEKSARDAGREDSFINPLFDEIRTYLDETEFNITAVENGTF